MKLFVRNHFPHYDEASLKFHGCLSLQNSVVFSEIFLILRCFTAFKVAISLFKYQNIAFSLDLRNFKGRLFYALLAYEVEEEHASITRVKVIDLLSHNSSSAKAEIFIMLVYRFCYRICAARRNSS